MGANSHAWEASLNLRWWVGKKDDLPVTTLGKYGALSLLPRKARPIHLFYTILETQVSIRVGTVRASGARRAGLPSGGALLSRAQTGAPPSLAVQGSRRNGPFWPGQERAKVKTGGGESAQGVGTVGTLENQIREPDLLSVRPILPKTQESTHLAALPGPLTYRRS